MERDGPFAAELAQFISYLGAYAQRFVEAGALLIGNQAEAHSLVAKFERHVGGAYERAWSIVDANPLQAGAAAYAEIFGATHCCGVVECRYFVILRKLGVGLRQDIRRK